MGDGYSFEVVGDEDKDYSSDFEHIYIITNYNVPSETYDATTTKYYAMHNSFVSPSDPIQPENMTEFEYFGNNDLVYTYVGEGKGNYVAIETTEVLNASFEIHYQEIYITGLQNNDWFYKYVLDGKDYTDTTTGATLTNINLDVYTTSSVNSFVNAGELDLSEYDLIVVSEGYQRGGNVADINATDISSLLENAVHNVPLLISSYTQPKAWPTLYNGILDDDGNGSLDNELLAKYPDVIVYQTDDADLKTSTIVNTGFYDDIDGTDELSKAFRDAIDSEVIRENSLRELTGVVSITSDVTMATAMRHLLNTVDRREDNIKTEINVLEIQAIYIPTDDRWKNPSASNYAGLKTSTVAQWTGFNESDIYITTMAVTEFIGKNENIFETYDLVYIGSSVYGFNTTTVGGKTITNYNDNSMDGLIYTNIGDTYGQENSTYGLIDSEYYINGSQYQVSGNGIDYVGWPVKHDGAVDTRFSGFDIPPAKLQELHAFAQAGVPIVIDDGVISNTVSNTTIPATSVAVTIDFRNDTNGTASVLDDVSELYVVNPLVTEYYPLAIAYQWQKKDASGSYVDISGANSYKLDIDVTDANGDYRCNVSVYENGTLLNSAFRFFY